MYRRSWRRRSRSRSRERSDESYRYRQHRRRSKSSRSPPRRHSSVGSGHGMAAFRVPICRDFISGKCRRPDCRYLHEKDAPPGTAKSLGALLSPVTPRGRLAAAREDIEHSSTLFVGNLPYELEKEDVEELFRKCGPCEVKLGVDKFTRQSRGFAFVNFEDRRDAKDAKERFGDFLVGGRRLRVDWDMGLKRKQELGYIGGTEKLPVQVTSKRRSLERGRERERSESNSPRRPRLLRSPSPVYSRSKTHSRSRSKTRSRSRSKTLSRSRTPSSRSFRSRSSQSLSRSRSSQS